MVDRKKIINKLEIELESVTKNTCVQYVCARGQRITELKAGLDLSGTSGYEVMGCYECKGDRIRCGAFYTYGTL